MNPTEPSKEVSQATPSKNTELKKILDSLGSSEGSLRIFGDASKAEALSKLQALLDQEYQRGYNAALKGMEITNLTDNSTILWDYQDTFTIRYKVGDKWVDVAELKKTRGTE